MNVLFLGIIFENYNIELYNIKIEEGKMLKNNKINSEI